MPKNLTIPFYKKCLVILSAFYGIMFFFWIFLRFTNSVDTVENYFFGFFLGFMPLLGFLFGSYVSVHWGFLKSKLGRAIFFVACGQLFWALGTFVFAYFNLILQQEVPYPSIADFFYLLLYVFYIAGTYNLAHATGARLSNNSKVLKLLIPVIPIIIFLLTYLFSLKDYIVTIQNFSLEVLLDLVYPLLDSILLSFTLITLILSYRSWGGKYSLAVYFLLFGFIVEFCADSAFTATTSNDTFFVGNWVDLLFLTSNFIVALALVLMSAERVLARKYSVAEDGK